MEIEQIDEVSVETIEFQSESLQRTIKVDFYQPATTGREKEVSLLLFNDGQDLVTMKFEGMLKSFQESGHYKPLLVAAIHCGDDRTNEYGMSAGPDYQGLGAKAQLYEQFILTELLPLIHSRFHNYHFIETCFAGFSLGGLSALDIVWNNPHIFNKAGIFSGSLWWRSLPKDNKEYDQNIHRMMHAQVRKGDIRPGLKFFFECGELDETEDRNKNGVIDSIDDTIDLMRELVRKGYYEGRDIHYYQMPNGKHDVNSWARAIPVFLKWGWG